MVEDGSQSQTPSDIEELKKQTEYIQQQTAFVKAKNELATAQATPLTSGLDAIKTAIGGISLPAGKEGTISFAAGTEGTALLRIKTHMIKLLDDFSSELAGELKEGAVVVTEAQLEKAYTAEFNRKAIEKNIESLTSTIESLITMIEQESPVRTKAIPEARGAIEKFMASGAAPAISAGISAVGSLLTTAHGITKLFRVDRKFDVFGADNEATLLLGYFLEKANSNFTARPDIMGQTAADIADKLSDRLDVLINANQQGIDLLSVLKNYSDSSTAWMPPHVIIARLKTAIETAKGLLEALHPVKNTEGFWEQVENSLLFTAIKDRPRIIFQIKAQAIQITEKRVWFGDRIKTSGEIQVAYRVLDSKGKLIKTGVIVRASKPEQGQFHKMPAVSYP